MGSVSLIAKVPFLYASRSLAIGDLFDASEQDAKILTHIGHAAAAPRLRYESAQLLSEKIQRAADEIEGAAKKVDRRTREYRRRDLVPEP